MTLLGRLEDLSLADIIQIVYLSRRTGALDVTTERGPHTLTFRNGLLVDASAADIPPFSQWLATRGVPDLAEVPPEALAEAVRTRIAEVIAPILESREGVFSFALADEANALNLEYDPDAVFKEGGLAPQRVLGTTERPLKALEASLRVGKALIRTAQSPENVVPFPATPIADDTLPLSARRDTSKFRVAGGLTEIEPPEARMRNVVLYEREPLIRVAAKRAFARHDITIAQFGSLEDVRRAASDWFRVNAFFVTVLEVGEGSTAILREVKRKNSRLPVAMIDRETDLRRRHDLLRLGADFYLTKPAGTAERELTLFADELVLFADRAFDQWHQLASAWGADAGKRFYEEASREQSERGMYVLKDFISELSNPNDIREIASTILRLATQFVDRAALFAVHGETFNGIGDAAAISIPAGEPSILSDVATSGEARRGKMKRTPANVHLIEALGGALPTEVIALPIVHNGRTIGILYGDNATHRVPIDSLGGLEAFLSQAGLAFESAMTASERAGTT